MEHVKRIDPHRNRQYCECGKPWPCRPVPVLLTGCTCGGIGSTGAHSRECAWT